MALALLLTGCSAIEELFGPGPLREHESYTTFKRYSYSLGAPKKFSQIDYVHTDVDNLLQRLNDVAVSAQEGTDPNAILKAYDIAYSNYVMYYTRANIAYIKYCRNVQDEYYADEYAYRMESAPLLNQALEECLIAFAKSPLRDSLVEYFDEELFEYYENHTFYSNHEAVELLQEQNRLLAQYTKLLGDMEISIDSEGNPAIADPSSEKIDDLLRENREQAAEILKELVRLRQELADVFDEDSYADLIFSWGYYRDYGDEKAKDYLQLLKQEFVPQITRYETVPTLSSVDDGEVLQLLEDTVYHLGGEIATAYEFMDDYELYDIGNDDMKMPGAYTVYLDYYNMPFIYVAGEGSMQDLLTVSHEFGHFVDQYVNSNTTYALDSAEIFSQALSYLIVHHADLEENDREDLLRYCLLQAQDVFLSQGAYADFELKLYELSPEEITADRIDELFLASCKEFGLRTENESAAAMSWMMIPHFFRSPFYTISYCISNDVALQIYEAELKEDGAGLKKYCELLQYTAENTTDEALSQANLEDPFTAERVAELTEFLKEQLK